MPWRLINTKEPLNFNNRLQINGLRGARWFLSSQINYLCRGCFFCCRHLVIHTNNNGEYVCSFDCWQVRKGQPKQTEENQKLPHSEDTTSTHSVSIYSIWNHYKVFKSVVLNRWPRRHVDSHVWPRLNEWSHKSPRPPPNVVFVNESQEALVVLSPCFSADNSRCILSHRFVSVPTRRREFKCGLWHI